MNADDPRHGSYAGAIQHYLSKQETCRPCKDAAATYRRNQRTRRYLARGPLTVPALGTMRRIQALCALGYHMCEIEKAIGRKYGYVSQLKRYPYVYRATAVAIADVYDRWSGTVPESTPLRGRQRKIASARGWAPPLAWDDIDHDKRPRGHRTRHSDRDYDTNHLIDEATVLRILDGETLPANHAERIETMRRWLALGRSEASLCKQMGWRDGRYVTRAEGAA